MKTINLSCGNCRIKMTLPFEDISHQVRYEAEKCIKESMKNHRKNCQVKEKKLI